MNLSDTTLTQIDTDEQFAKKTCQQLIREFNKIGIDLRINESTRDVNQLIHELKLEIDAIISNASHLLAQLFYSIDLPEEKVNKALESENDVAESIAKAILIRAAQKVYLREKFSS